MTDCAERKETEEGDPRTTEAELRGADCLRWERREFAEGLLDNWRVPELRCPKWDGAVRIVPGLSLSAGSDEVLLE